MNERDRGRGRLGGSDEVGRSISSSIDQGVGEGRQWVGLASNGVRGLAAAAFDGGACVCVSVAE